MLRFEVLTLEYCVWHCLQDSCQGSASLASIARLAILSLVIVMGLQAMDIAYDIVNLAFGLALGAVALSVVLCFSCGARGRWMANGALVESAAWGKI